MANTIERRGETTIGKRTLLFFGKAGLLAAAISHPGETMSLSGDVVKTVGSAAVAIFELASTDEGSKDTDQPIVVEVHGPVIETTEPTVVEVVPAITGQTTPEVGAVVDGWMLAPNYLETINSLNIEQYKKDFLVKIIDNIQIAGQESYANGYYVDPVTMAAQVVIETGYGTDTLSGPANNFTGAKAYGDDPYITVSTREVINGESVRKNLNFRKYPRPADSFNDYIRMMNELDWYKDVIACRHDYRLAAAALQNELDPNNCNLLSPQGGMSVLSPGKNVKSYATDPNYTKTILNVIDVLDLAKIFICAP